MGLAMSAGEAPNGRRAAAAGFSLIEAVVASLILLVVALGVLPLFSRAMASNFAGSESTSLANLTSARAEELYQLPFTHPALTVPAGATELVVEEVWKDEDGQWLTPDKAHATGLVRWTRQTRVRQFNISDLLTADPTPLDGGAPPGSVQVKEIEVEVTPGRESSIALGPRKSLRVRLFKAQ